MSVVPQNGGLSVPCACQSDQLVADSEQIELEIKAELSRCCCPRRFHCEKLDDDKYKVLFAFVVVAYMYVHCVPVPA